MHGPAVYMKLSMFQEVRALFKKLHLQTLPISHEFTVFLSGIHFQRLLSPAVSTNGLQKYIAQMTQLRCENNRATLRYIE